MGNQEKLQLAVNYFLFYSQGMKKTRSDKGKKHRPETKPRKGRNDKGKGRPGYVPKHGPYWHSFRQEVGRLRKTLFIEPFTDIPGDCHLCGDPGNTWTLIEKDEECRRENIAPICPVCRVKRGKMGASEFKAYCRKVLTD